MEFALALLVMALLSRKDGQAKVPANTGATKPKTSATDNTAGDVKAGVGAVTALVGLGVSAAGIFAGGGSAAAVSGGAGALAGGTAAAETAAATAATETAAEATAIGTLAEVGLNLAIGVAWVAFVMLIGWQIAGVVEDTTKRNLRLMNGGAGLWANFRMRLHNAERDNLEEIFDRIGLSFTRGEIPQSAVESAATEAWHSSTIATVAGDPTFKGIIFRYPLRDQLLTLLVLVCRVAATTQLRAFNNAVRNFYRNAWGKSEAQIEAEGLALSAERFEQLVDQYWLDHQVADWGLQLRHPPTKASRGQAVQMQLAGALTTGAAVAEFDALLNGRFWTRTEAEQGLSGTKMQQQQAVLGKALGYAFVAVVVHSDWTPAPMDIFGNNSGYVTSANALMGLGLRQAGSGQQKGWWLIDDAAGVAFNPSQFTDQGQVKLKGLDSQGNPISTGSDQVDEALWASYERARGSLT